MDITTSNVGIAKDIIMSIAACFTAGVAYSGLHKWKKELRGKIDFDTAHALIKATYKVRDELRYARSSFIPAHEFPKDYDHLEKSSKKAGDAFAYVYSNRMKHVFDATQDFDIRALEAEALWGNEIKEHTQEFRSCCSHLNISIETYVRNIYSGNEHFKADDKFKKEIMQDIWVSSKNDDPLSIKIHDTIKNLELKIRPYLVKK